MSRHITTRELEVRDGRDTVSTVEVRYTFTISEGLPARTWHTASDGNFYPAEGPTVDLLTVECRMHQSHAWVKCDGILWDLLCADISDAWFIEQAVEDAA